MKTKAFTLIEVLVTMTIISILAAMMIPAVWKFWESDEIAATKERMNAIKLGMVGDRKLIQNGIRTSYGFAGDNGELPFANSSSSASIGLLVTRPIGYPQWNGPYMSGFDPDEYRRDAWGRTFDYSVCLINGRYLYGALRSAGPDRKFGMSYDPCDTNGSATFCLGDDICIPLEITEVAPTHRLQGNFQFSFTNTSLAATPKSTYSANILIKYRDVSNKYNTAPDASGISAKATACKNYSSAALGLNETRQIFNNFTTLFMDGSAPLRLPVGQINIRSQLYAGHNCIGVPLVSSDFMSYFITDSTPTVFLNLPTVHATAP